jgi:site-specific DNA recombinase
VSKKKCYIYTRVSTAAQTEGYSLEAQQERLRQFADYKDLKVVGEYCDAGRSGKSIKGRPAFMEMLDDITGEKDDISFVLVFKLSRFGRNAADILKSIQLLADYDVDLVCVEDAIDSSTQGGKLTLAILSAVAEIERENINVQFMSGKLQKIMNGGWGGGPAPYGYRSVNKELVVEDTEADVVRKIFSLYLQDDMKANTVVRWLNDNGYSRIIKGEEKPFTSDFIKTVLTNPVYCGRLMYNRRTNLKGPNVRKKEEISAQGKHEALVSEEMWQQAQEKREELSAWGEKTEDLDRISILAGLTKCPSCGGGLVHMKNRKVNNNHGGYYKTIHYYACRNYRKSAGRTCEFKHTYNQEKVDNAVFEIVCNLGTAGRFDKAIDSALGDKPSIESYEGKIKELRKQLHAQEHLKYKLGTELDALDILADDYDERYENMQQKIDASYDEIERLEYEIKKCKKKLASLKKGVQGTENVKKILKNFPRLYEEMDCFEKREMYRYFIKRIDLFPEEQSDGKIIKSITFNFPVFYGDEEEETTLVERFTSGDKPDEEIEFTIDCSDMKPTVAEAKATYAQIRAYVMEHNGLKVPSLYIAQVKRKYGIELGKAYNKPEEPKNHVPKCPKEKELAIIDALKAYRMLDEGTEYKEDAVE